MPVEVAPTHETPATVGVAPPKQKQCTYRRPKFPRLDELHKILFGNIPANLHNSLIDVLVCLRCFLKIRCCVDVPEKSFERMIRNAMTLSYDGKPSPDHLYGVLRRHTDPPAVRLNPRTPTLLRRSGVLANANK